MQVETSREYVAVMVEGIEHLQGSRALRRRAAEMLEDLLSERDAATARAEAAERERDEFQTRSIAMHRRVSKLESGATYRWLVELREQFRKERDAATAERDAARAALEIIAGLRQCADNLMGNADVARAALASAKEAGDE